MQLETSLTLGFGIAALLVAACGVYFAYRALPGKLTSIEAQQNSHP